MILFLLASSIVVNVVGLVLIWRKVNHDTRKIENLINELGTMVGEWIDASENR